MKKSLRKSGATINVEVVDTVVSTGTVASTSIVDSSSTGLNISGKVDFSGTVDSRKVVTRIGVGESGGSTGSSSSRNGSSVSETVSRTSRSNLVTNSNTSSTKPSNRKNKKTSTTLSSYTSSNSKTHRSSSNSSSTSTLSSYTNNTSKSSTGTNTNRTTRNKSTWSKINRRRIVCCDTGEVFYSYRKYLLSRHWLLFKKRFRSSKYYRGCCYICSSSYKNHLHHISYERIGCELFSDVVELCSFPCHVNVHRAMKKGVSWDDVVRNLEVAVLSLVCYNVYMEIIMI